MTSTTSVAECDLFVNKKFKWALKLSIYITPVIVQIIDK